MRPRPSLTKSMLLSLLLVVFAVNIHATAVRTFVSSDGADANTASSCGRATPCKTIAAAYSQTNSGGEVVILDSAGIGTVTITTPVTITSIPGQRGYINVPSSSTGITINASAANIVVLRSLAIGGAGSTNTTGVVLNTGHLIIADCSFTQLTTGVLSSRQADVVDSDFVANTTGLRADGPGADTQSGQVTTLQTSVRISGGNFLNNTTALVSANPGFRTCMSCGGSLQNLFVRLLGNSSADYSVNIAGNGTAFSGTGTGCPGPFDCSIGTYSSTTNPH